MPNEDLEALIDAAMSGDDITILEKHREGFESALKFALLSSGINLVRGDMRALKSGVWKRQWRCSHYETMGSRCKWSVSLVSDPVPDGGVPAHWRVEGHLGHTNEGHTGHELFDASVQRKLEQGCIPVHVKEIVEACVRACIPLGRVLRLLAYQGVSATWSPNQMCDLEKRIKGALQDNHLPHLLALLKECQRKGSLPGLHVYHKADVDGIINSLYVMTPLGHLLARRFSSCLT